MRAGSVMARLLHIITSVTVKAERQVHMGINRRELIMGGLIYGKHSSLELVFNKQKPEGSGTAKQGRDSLRAPSSGPWHI